MTKQDDIFDGMGPGKAPVTLDNKIDALLSSAEMQQAPLLGTGVPVWACLLACLLSAFGGLLVRGPESMHALVKAESVVHVMRPSAELAKLLDHTGRPLPYPLGQ